MPAGLKRTTDAIERARRCLDPTPPPGPTWQRIRSPTWPRPGNYGAPRGDDRGAPDSCVHPNRDEGTGVTGDICSVGDHARCGRETHQRGTTRRVRSGGRSARAGWLITCTYVSLSRLDVVSRKRPTPGHGERLHAGEPNCVRDIRPDRGRLAANVARSIPVTSRPKTTKPRLVAGARRVARCIDPSTNGVPAGIARACHQRCTEHCVEDICDQCDFQGQLHGRAPRR